MRNRTRCDEYVNRPGSKTKPVFSSKVEDDGSIKLIETGKEDWYGYIQSWKDSVDIHVILKKCLNGDTSALARVQGFYGDVKAFPSTKPEMIQLMIDAEKNFNSLPIDIKEKFDYDVYKFIATMDKPEFYEKLGITRNEADVIKEEVKAE